MQDMNCGYTGHDYRVIRYVHSRPTKLLLEIVLGTSMCSGNCGKDFVIHAIYFLNKINTWMKHQRPKAPTPTLVLSLDLLALYFFDIIMPIALEVA